MQCAVNGNSMSRRLAAGLIFILALGAASGAYCQDDANDPLKKFEKSVRPPPSRPSPPAPAPAPRGEHDYDLGVSLGGARTDDSSNFIIDAASEVGTLTFRRLNPNAEDALRRDPGDIMIPFVRFDFFRQSVAPNIYAMDNRLEGGVGAVGMLFEEYIFHNQATGSGLTIDRQMLLFRMSPTRDFELDLGLGQTSVAGVERTPLGSFSMPARLRVVDGLIIEFIPTWSGIMTDYETALHWGGQYGSLKVGYRYLATPTAYLKGPFAGFALYF